MGLPQPKAYYTIGDYLEIERSSDERYEFLDGEIYLMAGESDAHGDICSNLIISLGNQLRETPCRVRSKDTKIRSGAIPEKARTTKGMFSYPDVVVFCGALQHHDEYKDVLINPNVVIEVLSESTAEFDRGEKFMRYRNWNPTLTDYILVSQDKPVVEHYVRQENGTWILHEYHGLAANFKIDSINCVLSLAEVFDRVEFPPDALDVFPTK
ncbi:MAG TPA: Uma2 family endonuclease [Pyrinomonadaceae bacterium]|jgi:Uma2 family endonuclease